MLMIHSPILGSTHDPLSLCLRGNSTELQTNPVLRSSLSSLASPRSSPIQRSGNHALVGVNQLLPLLPQSLLLLGDGEPPKIGRASHSSNKPSTKVSWESKSVSVGGSSTARSGISRTGRKEESFLLLRRIRRCFAHNFMALAAPVATFLTFFILRCVKALK